MTSIRHRGARRWDRRAAARGPGLLPSGLSPSAPVGRRALALVTVGSADTRSAPSRRPGRSWAHPARASRPRGPTTGRESHPAPKAAPIVARDAGTAGATSFDPGFVGERVVSSRAAPSSRKAPIAGSDDRSVRTWMQTWSAPASRCERTRSTIASVSPPGDDRVDQPVAAVTRQVGVGPAQAAQVVRVVGERQVALGEGPPDPAPLGGVRRQHGGLLDGEERLGTEVLPREGGVLGRDEVGVRAVGPLGGQLEHSWPQGGEHERDRRVGSGPP